MYTLNFYWAEATLVYSIQQIQHSSKLIKIPSEEERSKRGELTVNCENVCQATSEAGDPGPVQPQQPQCQDHGHKQPQ